MRSMQYALFRWYCFFGLHRWEVIQTLEQKLPNGSVLATHKLTRCQCCGKLGYKKIKFDLT